MKNEIALRRFSELLESRQRTHEPDRDIREHVLSLTDEPVGMGLVSEVLKTRFGANLPNIFPKLVPVDSKSFSECQNFFMHGTIHEDPENSHKGAVELLNTAPEGKDIVFMETSFLATTHSWIHSTKQKDPAYACLGYVYDDLGHYFMADYPNRINQKLNSDETPDATELARAERLLERIVGKRISKYNAQPMTAPEMGGDYTRRVLVCDQAYADASTIYGKVDDADFEQMLLAAIAENPDAEILVKTHPDSVWGQDKRTGYYAHLDSSDRVRILRDPVNPYVLFDLVDTVYVGTSQMGLEALFAGKKVVTFGAPFYAGWGLTDDRQVIPHRHRSRSLAELFHYFYIWYTIYQLPDRKGPAEIEDVLSFIEMNRPYPLPPTQDELSAPPKVSVVIPVYGVEKYVEECINSVQRQTLREIEIIPINDASPDDSQTIIDRLAATDGRIRPVILSQNIQLGMVRNRGIEEARGTYIWFLDSDDWLDNPDMLRQLYGLAEDNDLDMVRARKAYEAVFDENDALLRKRKDYSETFFQDCVPKTSFADSPVILKNRHCWTWLYRRDFLRDQNVLFKTPKWEERAFLHRAFVKSRAIGLMAIDGPAYRIRRNSISRRVRDTADFNLMLENFQHTFDAYVEDGAAERDHPLRGHLDYQLSQFVQHMLIAGPYRHHRNLGETEEAAFLAELRAEFARCDFRPDDFNADIPKLSDEHLKANAFPLMIAAILAERPEILHYAVDLGPVPQELLYQTLLLDDPDATLADLQAELNRYARNDKVLTAAIPAGTETPSRPRIVIHIGATKTGSTFLQHMLEKNRPALLREGVWFPEVGLFWQPSRPHKQSGHSAFTRAAVERGPSLRDHIRCGLELMEGRINTIVLSSEAFFLHKNAHRMADYFVGHPIEMVVYLRRQDEWANSQYCEFVAGGAVGRVDLPVDQWLDLPQTKRLLDYRNPLKAWEDKIGRENVQVRVFERSAFVDGDLLADFAEATGVPQLLDMPRPDTREQNEARLSGAHVELLRLFNGRPFASPRSYFDFIEDVGTSVTQWRQENGLPLTKPWVLDRDQADALMEKYADANAAVASEYLGRKTPLFGDRGRIPDSTSLQQEEFALVERIYARHAPPPAKHKPKAASKPAKPAVPAPSKAAAKTARSVAPKPAGAPVRKLQNYGLFGWRFWLLTPIVAVFYARATTPARFREFLDDPLAYSRRHWGQRHPLATWLLYPNGNLMGPLGVFRLWIPVARRLVGFTGRADMLSAFDSNPILFARGMRSPLRRLIGRVFFPIGELR